MAEIADVVVAGGGVIGTAIAWRAATAGLDVVLVDPEQGDAASLVAAGMLAPVSEALFGEGALLRLNLLAVRRFGSFAAELEEATGHRVGLRREGTLAVAYDPGDYAALIRLTAFRRSAGLDAEELDSRACRQLEPFLTPDVHGGVLFPSDWSVDSRRYAAALGDAARSAKVRFMRDRVLEVRIRDGRARGVRLADGELVVGATQEERGPDQTVTAGAVHDLLHDAMSVLPVTSELILAETCAGLRPGTPDNGPVVGRCGPDGLLFATGHYRNGILMSPVTADAAVALLSGQAPAPEWEPFTPQRFTGQDGSR